MTLKDKRKALASMGYTYEEDDVAKAVKELKKEMKEIIKLNKDMEIKYCDEIISDTIDKIFGEFAQENQIKEEKETFEEKERRITKEFNNEINKLGNIL